MQDHFQKTDSENSNSNIFKRVRANRVPQIRKTLAIFLVSLQGEKILTLTY